MMSNEVVILDNSLITSAYKLTLNEQRLILCALKKIEPVQEIEPNQAFYISRDDFIELGVNPDIVANEIRQATKDLMKKTVKVKTPHGTLEMPWLSEVLRFDKNAEKQLRERYPNPHDYNEYINALRFYNLVDSFTHRADDNIVARVVFHHKILPLLSNLKRNFTQFSIQDVAEFKSTYAHRIYQLMMQWKSTGCVKISIDDLRFMLMLGLKYRQINDLQKRVINVAIDEINEKSPYKVQCELIKKGRKFVALELKFEPKHQEKDNKTKEKIKDRDPNTIDLLDNLTDKEREIVANKNSYADQIGATELHRQNLINQGLEQHRQAEKQVQEQKEREKAERQAKKVQEQAEKLAKDEQERRERERAEQRRKIFIEMFENLDEQHQEQALDEVAKNFQNNIFANWFKEAREQGIAHKDPKFIGKFYELFGV